MKNVLRISLCFLLFSLVPVLAVARAEEKSSPGQFQNDFSEIKTRLANVEKQQQEIVAKDELILEKLDQLRVWVHRK